ERLASTGPRVLVIAAVRSALARAREEIQAGADPGDLVGRVEVELSAARGPRLRRAINATGVIVHTNLGRAPLAQEALERVTAVARGYSNLEYDLGAGGRGSRRSSASAERTASRSWTTSAPACWSSSRTSRRRETRWRRVPTSSASRETNCSAARRRVSSSAAASSSSGSGAILSSAPCART